jgi:uncharacterized oxidoreductase
MIRIDAPRLQRLTARILAASGGSDDDAEIVADHLVASNLAGHDSHGVGMLPQYLRAIRAGLLDPRAHATLEERGDALLSADGRRGFGQIVAREAMAAAIERARTTGLSLVALRNAFHVGRVGAYGEQAAQAGFVSLQFVNIVGHPGLVAPFRGSDARLATNPICVALPDRRGRAALLLDFATSQVAFGKVRVALQQGRPLPPGTLIDGLGRPTTDPAAMFSSPRGAILPFGLHKGYGLALACELLAGALTGGGTVSTVPHATDRIGNNLLAIVIDPERLPGADTLHEEVEAAIAHVKGSPPSDPDLPVLVAGEPERLAREERIRGGIELDDGTWAELGEAAATVGVALGEP